VPNAGSDMAPRSEKENKNVIMYCLVRAIEHFRGQLKNKYGAIIERLTM
jgi:hypothetical protein